MIDEFTVNFQETFLRDNRGKLIKRQYFWKETPELERARESAVLKEFGFQPTSTQEKKQKRKQPQRISVLLLVYQSL